MKCCVLSLRRFGERKCVFHFDSNSILSFKKPECKKKKSRHCILNLREFRKQTLSNMCTCFERHTKFHGLQLRKKSVASHQFFSSSSLFQYKMRKMLLSVTFISKKALRFKECKKIVWFFDICFFLQLFFSKTSFLIFLQF